MAAQVVPAAAPAGTPSATEEIAAFHEVSKHMPRNFAPGPDDLDWATQPHPFREFKDCGSLRLPLPPAAPILPYHGLYTASNADTTIPLASQDALSTILYHSMAVSAWKQHGKSKWSLRVNPSSGNLHPTETYIIADVEPLGPGLFHYNAERHALVKRASIAAPAFEAAMTTLPPGALLMGLSSVVWREAWKYGVRAFRYCQHDVGHALAALRFGARMLGARMQVTCAPTQDTDALFGLNRVEGKLVAEQEIGECLMVLTPDESPITLRADVIASLAAAMTFHGTPNELSQSYVSWPQITSAIRTTAHVTDTTAAAPETTTSAVSDHILVPGTSAVEARGPPAAVIVRQRRSAQDMDGKTHMLRDDFYALLARTVPQRSAGGVGGTSSGAQPVAPPFDCTPWPVRTHLLLFVHRVRDLEPGLYVLLRDGSPATHEEMKSVLRQDFLWERPPAAPKGLNLFLLTEGDLREHAMITSCTQEIAMEGAFAVSMLSRYRDTIVTPHDYRTLFWECGMIGQVLYLEAEALHMQGTGIGCFYDDLVHDMVMQEKVAEKRYQALYHFTVGGAIPDTRIQNLPAYDSGNCSLS